MKRIFFIPVIAFAIFVTVTSCQIQEKENQSKNWLMGKWKLDKTKEHSPLIKKILGDGTIEWTKDLYNYLNNSGKNRTSTYKITEISPERITFQYKIGQNDATETWHREQDNTIYLKGPSKNIAVYLIRDKKPFNKTNPE